MAPSEETHRAQTQQPDPPSTAAKTEGQQEGVDPPKSVERHEVLTQPGHESPQAFSHVARVFRQTAQRVAEGRSAQLQRSQQLA